MNGPTLGQAITGITGVPSPSNWYSNWFSTSAQPGIFLWTVPVDGMYTIRAMGASAGGNSQGSGGRGVIIQADVALVRGQALKLLIGQGGASSNADNCNDGAGGGTFVTDSFSNPLVVAGGGGGIARQGNGYDGVTSSVGGSSSWGTAGGSSGAGGGANQGASGAGLLGNGAMPQWGSLGGANNGMAQSFINGGQGGSSTQANPNRVGGFGGGGAGHGNCCIGGPGGGGYSGGAGTDSCQNGGGGGSFVVSTARNVQTSDGYYNGASTFGGLSIVNLAQYNSAVTYTSTWGTAGAISITLVRR